MKSSFCIDLQRFMLIPTKFPLSLTSALGTLNAWCVCDLNKTAFGWIVFFSVSLYIGVSIWKYVRRGLYVSHRYLCWWSIGLAYCY